MPERERGVAGEFTIELAGVSDVDEVLDFWRRSDARPSSTDNPDALTMLVTQFGGLLLARTPDLVGTLIASWDGWRGNMYRLVVARSARRRGIAFALVEAGERRLRDRGCQRITALVTAADDPAVGFWTAAGYAVDESMSRFVKML